MQNPEDFLRHDVGNRFFVKSNSIGPPTQYLRNKVSYVTLENGQSTWSFSLYQYVQDSAKNVIDTLYQEGGNLTKRRKSPWTSN